MKQKPSIGRTVIYNHSGSADGKFAPMKSPAIIQRVVRETPNDVDSTNVDMVVFSNSNGIFFAKNIPLRGSQDILGSNWEWPIIIDEVISTRNTPDQPHA